MADDTDFSDVFETMYGSASTGGVEEIVTVTTRAAGDEDGQNADEMELWGLGCVLYRPAEPDDDGMCQVMTTTVGGRKVAHASRDSRASKAFGALNKGDACFGSPTGKGVFRANADGSVGFRRSGVSDAWIHIEKTGELIFGNEWGVFELSAEGFSVILKDGTFLNLKAGEFNVGAKKTHVLGTFAQGPAPLPIADKPITGTVGAGFVPLIAITGLTATPG